MTTLMNVIWVSTIALNPEEPASITKDHSLVQVERGIPGETGHKKYIIITPGDHVAQSDLSQLCYRSAVSLGAL